MPAPDPRLRQIAAQEPVCASPQVLKMATNQFLGHDLDDSWHMNMGEVGPAAKSSPVANGCTMVWEGAGPLAMNREATLRFKLLSANGQPLPIEPYMGMFGHAAVRRKDGAVFAHVHPMGTISMASQEFFERRAEAKSKPAEPATHLTGTTESVAFPYEFPQSGPYRIWVQMKADGRVYTGVFDADVQTAN